MSGQSANLSLKEARAMQERVQCGTNHSHTHGGHKSPKAPMPAGKPHENQKFDHADAHNE